MSEIRLLDVSEIRLFWSAILIIVGLTIGQTSSYFSSLSSSSPTHYWFNKTKQHTRTRHDARDDACSFVVCRGDASGVRSRTRRSRALYLWLSGADPYYGGHAGGLVLQVRMHAACMASNPLLLPLQTRIVLVKVLVKEQNYQHKDRSLGSLHPRWTPDPYTCVLVINSQAFTLSVLFLDPLPCNIFNLKWSLVLTWLWWKSCTRIADSDAPTRATRPDTDVYLIHTHLHTVLQMVWTIWSTTWWACSKSASSARATETWKKTSFSESITRFHVEILNPEAAIYLNFPQPYAMSLTHTHTNTHTYIHTHARTHTHTHTHTFSPSQPLQKDA